MLKPRPNDYADLLEYEGDYVPGEPIGLGRGYPAPEKVPMHPSDTPPPEVFPPTIQSVTPLGGIAGSQFSIAGDSFGARGPNSRVTIGTEDAPIVLWQATAIIASVPDPTTQALDTPLPVTVYTDDGQSVVATDQFTIQTPAPPAYVGPPVVTSIQPLSGMDGTTMVITGTNFGANEGTSRVIVGTIEPATIVDWSDTEITCIPVQAVTPQDVPQNVTVYGADESSDTADEQFTFTGVVSDTQSTQSHKRKR